MSTPAQKPTILLAKPLVLKKEQLFLSSKQFIKIRPPLYKEDVIYESKNGDFLGGESLGVTIVNKLNRLTNSSVTIAKYKSSIIEKTSERVARLIGQRNYDIVFSALCSVISQELKVRAILALLTSNKPKDTATQTLGLGATSKEFCDAECQTEETISIVYKKTKPKRRVKRQTLAPYVAQEVEKTVKKIVIHPNDYKDPPELTNLDLNSDNSNDSIGNLSSLSITTTNSLLYNPSSILDNVDRYSRQVDETDNINVDMTVSMSPRASGMLFGNQNVATSVHEKRQILKNIALMDFSNCDRPDEDGYLPIHYAVQDNDMELLIRQCLALNRKKKSVDWAVDGDWTPLKMAILKNQPNMTAILLRFNANPLLSDNDQKTAIHHAAEMPHSHLQAIVEHCLKNPRKILEQNDELWDDNYETMPDDRLSILLLGKMCSTCDNQGYIPLMLASKIGNYENVELLVRIAPGTINKQMPTCGNTALYLSIGAACTDCIERGDKTVVAPNFTRTIEALLTKGADPGIDNRSGSNVNILLTEFNIAPLSTLVANKLTSVKYFDGTMPEAAKNFDKYMLVKTNEGTVDIMEMNQQKIKTDEVKKNVNKSSTNKLVKSPTVKDNNILVKTVPNVTEKINVVVKMGPTVITTDKLAKTVPTKVNTKSDKPVIVQNILLSPSPGGSRKRKSSDMKIENTSKKILQTTETDNKVKSGKASKIKDIKIIPAKQDTKIHTIRQPAKKRIKNIDNAK